MFRLTLPRIAGTLLRTSPLPLIPVTAAPGEADPGIQDAAVTTGTALPPPTGEFPVVRADDEAGSGDDGPQPPGGDRPGAVSGRGETW